MIIDFHAHITFPLDADDKTIDQRLSDQVAVMDRNQVEAAVVSLIEALYSNCADYRAANDLAARACARFPGKFFPMAVVNPYDQEKAAEELRRSIELLGMKGLKLHPWLQGFSVSDPYIKPVMEECQRLKIPVVFHDGTPPYSSSLQIANLAKLYPEATIVLGHSGLNDLWRNAQQAALEYENIYLCLCGVSTQALETLCATVPHTRLLYGSDLAWDAESVLQYRLHKVQSLSLDEASRELILSGNARRLLGERA